MRETSSEQYHKLLSVTCSKGKHKIRENNFGVVLCSTCGRLFNGDTPGKKLLEEDKLLIISK